MYGVKIRVLGKTADEVYTYFGIREIEAREDGVYINGKREFQQMILDQGYWKDTMLTAPGDEAIEKDVRAIREMGFNGVRMHQKVESFVFYSLCDKYGLYVWGEIPSAYAFDERMKTEFLRDCTDIVEQLKNHPCVVSWVLFNETWGVSDIKENKEEQNFVQRMYEEVRKADDRPIITNDGWYHLGSDILSLQNTSRIPKRSPKNTRIRRTWWRIKKSTRIFTALPLPTDTATAGSRDDFLNTAESASRARRAGDTAIRRRTARRMKPVCEKSSIP